MKSKDLLDELDNQALSLPDSYDEVEIDALIGRIKLAIRKIFGDDSHYLDDLEKITFVPPVRPRVASSSSRGFSAAPIDNSYWTRGKAKTRNLLLLMLEDRNYAPDAASTEGEATSIIYSRKVFVVHGHDEEMKQSVARVLSQLEMEPIILHEQANKGRTLIEKFDSHADVGFAIVLLSPDDVGRKKGADVSADKSRARQNVVFELGYFMGKLGRERVVVLRRSSGDFENPSDTDGVVYTPYDDAGAWKFALAKELKACGYAVDMNQI